MSDLDTSLRELREDLRSTITKPGLDRVADRARQRSVRRRMQIGAIVAVVLVSVAVPLMRSLPEPTPPASPPPTTATRASVPYQLTFADRTHVFALGRICPGPFERCSFRLMASADAGRSWQRRTMPGGTHTEGSLGLLGRRALVFYTSTGDADNFLITFISRDEGRSWRRYDIDRPPLASPAPIPSGTPIQVVCLSGSGNDCVVGLGTADDDGTIAPVPVQPPLTDRWPGHLPTASGMYWSVGRDQAGRWAIAVTSDGRTWRTTPLDVPGTPQDFDTWSVVDGGGSMYLTALGTIGDGPNKLLMVYRSKDRGRTWTQTRRATETNDHMTAFGSPVATSDGRLLVSSLPDGTVESRDGGRTFVKAARQLPATPKWTAGGYLVQVDPMTYEISWNGRDWRRFEIP
jgi:hypothetical protein